MRRLFVSALILAGLRLTAPIAEPVLVPPSGWRFLAGGRRSGFGQIHDTETAAGGFRDLAGGGWHMAALVLHSRDGGSRQDPSVLSLAGQKPYGQALDAD